MIRAIFLSSAISEILSRTLACHAVYMSSLEASSRTHAILIGLLRIELSTRTRSPLSELVNRTRGPSSPQLIIPVIASVIYGERRRGDGSGLFPAAPSPSILAAHPRA